MFTSMNAPESRRASTRNRDASAVEKTAVFHAAHNRWPSATSEDPAEKELGIWLYSQRKAHADGSIDIFRASALDQLIPGWLQSPDETWMSWARKVSDYVLEHGRMPTSKEAESGHRRCFLWLRIQRANQQSGVLRADRNAWLTDHCPGWAQPA